MRTATYCRYSDDAQSVNSIRDQLRNVEEYCARVGWPQPTLYQDKAITGSRTDRPGYQAMMEAALAGLFDVLLVDDLSRFARDYLESGQAVRLFKYKNIRLIGVSDGVDTDRTGYKLEIGMRGLMAELYLDDLAEKTHRGLKGLALEGYSAGGLPFGYSSTHDGHGSSRSINEDEAKWVRWIFERYVAGDSPRTIAASLNDKGIPSPRDGKWSPSAIYPDQKGVGILANDLYNGRQIWNKTKWVKNPTNGRRKRTERPQSDWVITEHPELQIIDDETWAAVKARIQATRNKTAGMREKQKSAAASGGRGPRYLFSGLLKCGCCGGPYVIVDRYRYGCNIHKDRGVAACANSTKIAREKVENILLEGIKKDLLSEEAYRQFERETRQILKDMQPDPTEARRKVEKARKEAENILNAIRQGIITPSTKRALEEAEEAAKTAEAELSAILAFQPTQILPRAREIFKGMVEKLECINDVAAAREAIRAITGDITLTQEDGELYAELTKGGIATLSQITLVAGAGFEPTTFGL
ncbi:recombinase family protein [Sideroxydans sp.]